MADDPCHDDAIDIVDAFILGMQQAYDPASSCPPDGGDTPEVRFFAGDGELPASLILCDQPMLWVRVAHRYRSRIRDFPSAYVGDAKCGGADMRRVLAVEVGVGRCSTMDAEPNWATLAEEARASLDDSWRLERVLCAVASRLRAVGQPVATDTVAPYGPAGGVIAWTGMAYVQF